MTRTRGRPATLGVIPGRYALSVGHPGTASPEGFQWTALCDLARLESGHTPSRRLREYWDGDIHWIGLRDAIDNHGRTIFQTYQHITQDGLDNSAARLLPAGTVCLSRTASVGYVVRMGVAMATSQDFIDWVCGPELESRYLQYILLAEGDSLLQFASGTTHQTIYFSEAKAFHVCIPSLEAQRRITDVLGTLDDKIDVNRRMSRRLEELARAHIRSVQKSSVTRPLGTIATVNELRVARANAGLINYVEIGAVSRGVIKAEEIDWTVAPSRAQRGVRDGDTVLSTVRPERGAFFYATRPPQNTVVSSGFAVVHPHSRRLAPLVYCWLTDDARLQDYGQVADGGAYPAMNSEYLRTLEVPIPEEESPALTVADELLSLRAANERESHTVRELRDLILPRLIVGELRVRDAEELVEAAT
jgi:type I restriction enzyme, S subunit